MKIKELIEKLKEIEAKEGDVEIYLKDDERYDYQVSGVEFNPSIQTGKSSYVNGRWIPMVDGGWVIQ